MGVSVWSLAVVKPPRKLRWLLRTDADQSCGTRDLARDR